MKIFEFGITEIVSVEAETLEEAWELMEQGDYKFIEVQTELREEG